MLCRSELWTEGNTLSSRTHFQRTPVRRYICCFNARVAAETTATDKKGVRQSSNLRPGGLNPTTLLAQDDLPEPSLKDLPALAMHASVIAVRRPASLLLPATATLFCARCAAKVAEIALRLQESDRLNAWAGAQRSSPPADACVEADDSGESACDHDPV
jgi:hypothetical protein